MNIVYGVLWSCCLLALASCSDTRPAANGDSCEDGANCDCTDSRPGKSVCDVDTHAFVMCDCSTPTQREHEDTDAGADRAGSVAAGGGGSRADAGRMAAADGGKMGAAGHDAAAAGKGGGDQAGDGDGAAGDGAAGHPGKALGNSKVHGPKH